MPKRPKIPFAKVPDYEGLKIFLQESIEESDGDVEAGKIYGQLYNIVHAAADVPKWTQEPPTEQGTYWHWNGDQDCAPVPMFVLWSGSARKCFVAAGQLCIPHAVMCDEYGGWWKLLRQELAPNS
jgi:hypothetical protein